MSDQNLDDGSLQATIAWLCWWAGGAVHYFGVEWLCAILIITGLVFMFLCIAKALD